VSVRHTGTNNPVRIPLTGSGGTQPGTLEASTTSLAFGDVRQGERPSQAVTLTNRGGAEVLIDAPALSGDQLDQFSAALPSAAPLRLAPGASTTLTVTFAPNRVGAASATVTVAHSGSNPAVTISASGTGQSGGGTQPQAGLSRLQASSRVETAVEVSRATFGPGIEVAYVATANNFPDALAAGPAAGRLGAPILLAGANLPVPQATAEELDRLNPRRIVVLGGDTVLSENVRAALVPYATSGEVTRLGGNNRYETAASISATHFTPGVPVVYLASGEVFPDALSGGPAAARDGGPVLLVQSSGIPAATQAELQRLAPERVVVLGGALRIPDSVMSEAAGFATSRTATRMSGNTRYGTAADVSAKTHPGGAAVVYIATGENFPDALAAVPAAAKGQAPLLLVTPSGIPSEVDAELRRLNPSSIVVLGGETAVSNIVYGLLAATPARSAGTAGDGGPGYGRAPVTLNTVHLAEGP
jgi:putative cell wall-binding protein